MDLVDLCIWTRERNRNVGIGVARRHDETRSITRESMKLAHAKVCLLSRDAVLFMLVKFNRPDMRSSSTELIILFEIFP